ncbi:sigma-54-dependent transcriptional regulator [Psychromonas aquimarina]|uniref:sigma-54-dependent transcriptional regulator n=1 Tax=Psychromonas aquimarina TaxID=444919 RepID=UPI00042023EF|nr:sigma-54 dependent transcriptional regulator [Psychromonas aquimarina]
MSQGKLLVVEDDAGLREALIDTLLLAGYDCSEVDSGEAALVALTKQKYDLVISDIQMGGMSGLTLLQNIKDKYPLLPVLLMTAYATIDDAVNAMRDGAIDYLAKPFSPEVLLNQVSRYAPVNKVESCTPIYGDPSTARLFQMAEKVAASDASVMVTGPSGSGKEVLSRYLHDKSSRSEQSFVAINCGAIPETMLESTLFGYEKGAFTGAVQACPGKFEQAQNGTILLDEISEMPLDLQVKLLRVLQEREVERLGSRKTIKLNIRVIATSNRDIKKAVEEGTFREDLYYRLNVFPLQWLPLGRRKGDILPLAEHLLQRHALEQSQAVPVLTDTAKTMLQAYPWPGNVRELDNVMQRALILSDGEKIDQTALILEDMQFEHIQSSSEADNQDPAENEILEEDLLSDLSDADERVLGKGLKEQEQKIILDALQTCRGKRKDVAELLGISPRTLRYKIARMKDQGIALPV